MAIRVALNHRTAYKYDRLVTLSPQVIRLRPAPHCRTPVTSYSLKITPEKHFLNWQQDPHGNFLARAVFPELTREFSLEVDLVAELTVINPFDFFLEAEAMEYPFAYADWLATELAAYKQCLPMTPAFQEFVNNVPRKQKGTVDFLVDLNRYVHEAVGYVIRLEPGVQTCEETLTKKTGSCRDSAWLLVQTLRNLGLAARFVSGYLIQLAPDVKSLDGPSGTEIDFTDLHAWTEVYLPGAGWVGLDPTSALFAGEGHLPLAATPEPFSAAPISGGVDECKTEFEFHMTVTRIHEDPRVTKPYSDEQWSRIEALGKQVDDVLDQGNVKLTMGGEPTFVSIDDMDSPEWNTAALGPHKRKLAGDLFDRLAGVFAKGPLLHYGQGKWYPGEQLPRWALGCYWRNDSLPIWRNPDRIAKDNADTNYNEADAKRFITTLAEKLEVRPEHCIPGFEDAFYYLWKERRLPTNVDPFDSRLSDKEERARLARVFEQGLEKTIGYTLPLRPLYRDGGQTIWQSGRWFLRAERMYLIPGDSPMGYRLPLDSIPWVAAKDYPQIQERDPFAPRENLPTYDREPAPLLPAATYARVGMQERNLVRQLAGVPLDEPIDWSSHPLQDYSVIGEGNGRHGNGNGNGRAKDRPHDEPAGRHRDEPILPADQPPQPFQSASGTIRTAICVEARQGTLHLFMPPVGELEDYLHLVSKIEETCEATGLPIRLEGYTPPHDPRITHFKITPDPGVIEVNLQPAKKWSELVFNTTTLYDEARQSRLGTEKFMLDGRHTGTGGGNHIVLGGATPRESPFLRRPDVLASLITYWNNRPSLSYIFSGLFIGPTSQAPRVDEARHENVYELETAFAQLPKDGTHFPWLVDRVLRNLLVDLTGNTHRAEFCIDKLYSPDSSTGRLGLVEMRGFEMPPHARMSLTQQLLVRALLARFWKQPYRQPLVRWGTSLHDRFMLPHFLAQDFAEVLEELNDAGFAFQQDWFDSHFEFRFPFIGKVTQRSVDVELRQAMEPWHVLGEEGTSGGTARYVDSSVERLQVKVRGMTDPRHIITVNGRRVPLHPTGTPGEFVAGVRYRAWQPPSCLHPTIGVHTPLKFDVVDLWNSRSIGGCTWHVAHPGGRNFDRFPVNAYEAESRRTARFFAQGHTGGKVAIAPPEHNSDYPFTMDLRRPIEPAALDE